MDDYKSRNIILIDSIDQNSIKYAICDIYNINEFDFNNELEFKNYEREPINFILSSFGGDIYCALSLIGAIQTSITPIHITVLGYAMSAGFYILLAGHKRIMHKKSFLMLHNTNFTISDDTNTVKNEMIQNEKIDELLDNIIIERTKITKSLLKKKKIENLEWYFNADEAIKYNIVDQII
jgi:ATP-dependent Clp protease, protease subunit